MTQNVIISLTGTQLCDGTQDKVEMLSCAVMRQMGNITEISYDEPEENGFEQSRTVIRAVGTDSVSIERTGKYATHLFLEKGRRRLSHYDMTFGGMTMGVSTHSIRNSLSPAGGSLQADYTLEMNHSLVSNNRFLLKIVEVKNDNEKSEKLSQ